MIEGLLHHPVRSDSDRPQTKVTALLVSLWMELLTWLGSSVMNGGRGVRINTDKDATARSISTFLHQ